MAINGEALNALFVEAYLITPVIGVTIICFPINYV